MESEKEKGSHGKPANPCIFWWSWGELNPRPLPCQGSALPLRHSPRSVTTKRIITGEARSVKHIPSEEPEKRLLRSPGAARHNGLFRTVLSSPSDLARECPREFRSVQPRKGRPRIPRPEDFCTQARRGYCNASARAFPNAAEASGPLPVMMVPSRTTGSLVSRALAEVSSLSIVPAG